jgi:hypothetical protein
VTLADVSQTYTGSPLAPTATTSPLGLTMVWTGTPRTDVGSYPVTATISDANYQGSANDTFVIAKANQTITFAPLAAQTYGSADFTISAAASSGLPVSFGASGNCSVSVATVHITGAGSCTITASQGGSGSYNPAAEVPRTFAIAKLTPVFTNLSETSIILGTPTSTVSGKLSVGALVPTGSVLVGLDGTTQVAAIQSDGTFASVFNTTGLDAGAYPNTFAYAGDANFALANATSSSVHVTYKPVGAACLNEEGHAVVSPVNGDGTSVFKKGSTVPVKFRVCDANGNSVGTNGVVAGFALVQSVSGTVANANETVLSTTGDAAFRWDPTARQWIFNLSTKNLTANVTYSYVITLKDQTVITFRFGLK